MSRYKTRTFATTDESEDQDEKLNIFSLASGHLYERFLKIMMLSVIKHTKTPVKFWFLKNYLSPTLKVSKLCVCVRYMLKREIFYSTNTEPLLMKYLFFRVIGLFATHGRGIWL